MLQLNRRIFAPGYPHDEQTFFWRWNDTLPHRRQSVCVLLWRFPKDEVPFVCERGRDSEHRGRRRAGEP